MNEELYKDDILYFIDMSPAFYNLIRKSEERQTLNIERAVNEGKCKPTALSVTNSKYLSTADRLEAEERRSNKFGLNQRDYDFTVQFYETNDRLQAAVDILKKYNFITPSKEDATYFAKQTLKKRGVQELVKHLNQKALEKSKISKMRILNEMAHIAFLDPRDYFDADNRLIPLSKLSREQAAGIKRVKTIERQDGSTSSEIEFLSKLSALTELDKHAGLYNDPLEDEGGASSKKPVVTVNFNRYSQTNINTAEPIKSVEEIEFEDVDGETIQDDDF